MKVVCLYCIIAAKNLNILIFEFYTTLDKNYTNRERIEILIKCIKGILLLF